MLALTICNHHSYHPFQRDGSLRDPLGKAPAGLGLPGLGSEGPQCTPYQLFVFRLGRGQIALVPLTTFRALPPFYYVSKHLIAGKPIPNDRS